MSEMKSGKLFVIDGTDGSGKNTQAIKLLETLVDRYNLTIGKDIIKVSFPNYGTPGCTMVEKYLNGEFGSDPNKIDAYTSSMFYMIDRSISYMNDKWGEVYRNGGIVIADRYYTSNIIHQGAKILNECNYKESSPDAVMDYYDTAHAKFKALIQWLTSTEIRHIQIPAPNKIFWLMTDANSNTQMLDHRTEVDTSHNTDIHEADNTYLESCRSALRLYRDICKDTERNRANKYYPSIDMNFIDDILTTDTFINVLNKDNTIRTVDSISNEIVESIVKYLALYGMYPGYCGNV